MSRATNVARTWKRRLDASRSTNNGDKKSKKGIQASNGAVLGTSSASICGPHAPNSNFSDFGSYMAAKNRKLQAQFNSEASHFADGSSIRKLMFEGISIFVDGFTIPSSQELRGYMLKRGGRFQNYFSRQNVTHIICSHLSHSKIKNVKSFNSGGLPVVKPEWISDSIAANKLLNWIPYQLDQLANNNQPKLSAFFAPKCVAISETRRNSAAAACDGIVDPFLKGGPCNNPCRFEEGEGDGEGEPIKSKISMKRENSLGVNVEESDNSGNIDGNIMNIERCQSTLHELSPSGRIHCSENYSIIEDANFLDKYFKASRLHFIGTWRNRYRKRFPHVVSKCAGRSSDTFQDTTIIHVDMDCFFVSVVIRNHPELQDKPVAVCHSDNPKGTAEISSANYPAREYGVGAGIFVKDAKTLCPNLLILPYDFKAYEVVADQFYTILHKHCSNVQAVSCDEAFVDMTGLEGIEPERLASTIRSEIFETTGCTASAGIAGNMLLARLATREAKPDGQCHIPRENVEDYLHQLPIKAIQGVGRALEEKLNKENIRTCGELRMLPMDSLQKNFGMKTGEMLWNYCRGIDKREVGFAQEIKSVGAEVNWGVRFRDAQNSEPFLSDLCKEVSSRLQQCGMQGRTFTLKIKRRRKDAAEPAKYMGCGDCENLSHSITVPCASDDAEVLQKVVRQLLSSFGELDVRDIRGVGLQASKLESSHSAEQVLERNFLRSWIDSASTSSGKQVDDARNEPQPPPLSQLDMEVVGDLPSELVLELNEIYSGKLEDFIAANGALAKSFPVHSSPCQVGIPSPQLHADSAAFPSASIGNLWVGNPPNWVNKFQHSECLMLKALSESYHSKSALSGNMSDVLRNAVSRSPLAPHKSSDSCDEDGVCCLAELLKQYFRLKIESDIEEIHTCCSLLNRLASKSMLLKQVCEVVFPLLQASVGEHYGGNLHLPN